MVNGKLNDPPFYCFLKTWLSTWGYSKSLRKGYYLFTDKFEYEEIKSIKRVKENVVSICLSADPYSCYFINGYLVHNTSICGACVTCDLWPAILQPYGPHTYNSSSFPVTRSFGLGYTQAQLYNYAVNLYSDNYISSTWQSNSSTPRLTPWNSFLLQFLTKCFSPRTHVVILGRQGQLSTRNTM